MTFQDYLEHQGEDRQEPDDFKVIAEKEEIYSPDMKAEDSWFG
jgi:hypothetical protein